MKKSNDAVGDTNLGLDRKQREGAIALLNLALANASVLTIKTKKMHWDVVGPQFITLHRLWDEQYETLSKNADELAERIRMLGGYPLGTAQGFLSATKLEEYPGNVPNATNAVEYLLRDHEAIARSLRKSVNDCQSEHNDAGTADLLTVQLKGHEKMAWMLRSFLLGTPVVATGDATHGIVPALA